MEDCQDPRQIPVSGQSDEQSLSGQVCQSAQVPDPTGEGTGQSTLSKGVGGVCQAPLWSSQGCAGIPGQVYPQSSDLQPSDSGHWSNTDQVQLQRLPAGRSKAGDEPGQSGVYPAILHAYPPQRTGANPPLWNIGKFGQAGHDTADPSGTWNSDSGTRTQDSGNLQSTILPLLPKGKHGEHPAPAQAWPAKGGVFCCPDPNLIPDFDRAGEAMPARWSGRPMLQKSPSKTGLEGQKIL